jgi:hypothetical protein
MSDMIGDGPFQGIVTPCDTCLGVGELITLQDGLVKASCPRCNGVGHVHIRCAVEEVDEVVRRLPLTRQQLQTHRQLASIGACAGCFGAGVVASVECDADETPIRYVEAPCPACTAN